jgi:hypothetical protein
MKSDILVANQNLRAHNKFNSPILKFPIPITLYFTMLQNQYHLPATCNSCMLLSKCVGINDFLFIYIIFTRVPLSQVYSTMQMAKYGTLQNLQK